MRACVCVGVRESACERARVHAFVSVSVCICTCERARVHCIFLENACVFSRIRKEFRDEKQVGKDEKLIV